MAKVDIINGQKYDAEAIIALPGYDPNDPLQIAEERDGQGNLAHRWLMAGGIQQADLEAVIAAYDPAKAQRKVEAIEAMRLLEESDSNLPRRLEDIYHLFIDKSILTEADFEAASPGLPAKIAEREALRSKL